MNLQLSFMYCNILVNPTFLYYYAKLCHKRFKKMFSLFKFFLDFSDNSDPKKMFDFFPRFFVFFWCNLKVGSFLGQNHFFDKKIEKNYFWLKFVCTE